MFSFLTLVKCSGLLFPALLTKISNLVIFCKIFLNSSNCVTSHTNDLLEPFVFLIILFTLSKSDLVLLKIITFAPASAKAIAHALPSPLPAPVTRAVLFLRLIFFSIKKIKF